MKFVIKIYLGECFIGDAYAKTIAEAKQKASRLCNNYLSPIDRFVICGGEFNNIAFIRINRVDPANRIYRGTWK